MMPAPLMQVHVPMAPEGGLFLERCMFEAYNTRWSHQHERLDLADFAPLVQAFKVIWAACFVCAAALAMPLLALAHSRADMTVCLPPPAIHCAPLTLVALRLDS